MEVTQGLNRTMNNIDYSPITVRPATWPDDKQQLLSIRTRAFVDEQQEPADEKLDEHDTTAQHWLAYDTDKPVGAIRLVNSSKVGRLAVLPEYRGKGVGGALMRRIILDASSGGITNLTLQAQAQTIPFYEKFGFQARGPEFEEAGITHREMVLDLGPYRYLSKQFGPADSSRQILSSVTEFTQSTVSLIQQSRQHIRVFSDELSLPFLESPPVLDALRLFSVTTPTATIQILVRYTAWLEKSFHPLLELQKRLTSHVEVRQLAEEFEPQLSEYLIFDESALLRVTDTMKIAGFAAYNATPEARQLINEFDHMWPYSSTPVGLRQLDL